VNIPLDGKYAHNPIPHIERYSIPPNIGLESE
jgi:hypothetical protein